MSANDDVFAARLVGWSWDVGETPTWQPLWVLARLSAQRPELPAVHPQEFMYMGRLEAHDRLPVHLYKHSATRQYLSVDDAGHTYRLTRRAAAEPIYAWPCRNLADELRRVLPNTSRTATLDHPTAPQDPPEASL
jgi:hypothetical protein